MAPSRKELDQAMTKVRDIATLIVSGEIDPHVGCDQIASLCQPLDFPSQLDEFFHLSHLQNDHSQLGVVKEDLTADIIEEAKKFLSNFG
jgi:hypothetical protein